MQAMFRGLWFKPTDTGIGQLKSKNTSSKFQHYIVCIATYDQLAAKARELCGTLVVRWRGKSTPSFLSILVLTKSVERLAKYFSTRTQADRLTNILILFYNCIVLSLNNPV